MAPDSGADRLNLALILLRAQKHEESLQALAQAQKIDPDLVAVHYLRGIIYKRQNRFAEAVESLEQVIARDPQCRGAYYNLGVCYKFLQQYPEAISAFNREIELSPTDPSTHYQLLTLYRRLGQMARAARHAEIYDRVKNTVDESEKTAEALERSKYTYIIEAPRLTGDLKPRPEAKVRFVEITAESGLPAPGQAVSPKAAGRPRSRSEAVTVEQLPADYAASVGGAVALADYDGDGDLDIYATNCSTDTAASTNRLYQNDGRGTFVDVTPRAGVGDAGLGMDAVFGDYDNDGHTDLYVVNHGPNVLYRNAGDGTFEDVSKRARVNEPHFGRRALLLDYDHDNDLDIFVANDVGPALDNTIAIPDDFSGQSNTLLRNNGNGTFSDQTDEAGLLVSFAQTRDALAADFDGDHDIDLFLVNADAPPESFANTRLGRFTVGGSFSPPIPTGGFATAEGDFNRDGCADLLVALDEVLYLYTNDGRADFTGAPIQAGPVMCKTIGRIRVFDFNNDGWNDLLLAGAGTEQRLSLLAGDGPQRFHDVTTHVGLDQTGTQVVDSAAGDLDGDGDEDIVLQTRGRGVLILRNDSQERGHWLDVHLVGQKVNRSAYGATVEIASGGHYQKQTCRRGWVHFGLGDLEGVDVVRVTWPNGVAQNVTRPAINRALTVEEYVRVSASCGFLYTFNGQGFELVNEILGIGPLGVPMAPGVYHQPDCTELTKVEAGQLAAKDGLYELRLTEELRETMYADQFTLRVVDHPADLEIVPNEYFAAPPFPEDKFFAVAEHRPPQSAVDDRGGDVLDLVLEHDGRFPTFAMTPYDGLAEPHSLTLDLGDLGGAEQIVLFLDGWIYWPDSSTVMAIAQDPRFSIAPLKLEVRERWGAWRTAIESVGLPTSKGLVVPVDLTGRFLCRDYRVRLSTNMCVYFDRVFVSTDDQAARCRQTELPVAQADLHYRGFSSMTRDAFGYERFDYDESSPIGPWSPPVGMLTRYGEVTPLLAEPDDMYVIFGPGDELTMRFDAGGLPGLPAGWTRDFIFYANGWVKDGDLNTKFSETVAPLPFHGMSGYPYRPDEHYPVAPELRRYRRQYNTRSARSTVGSVVP